MHTLDFAFRSGIYILYATRLSSVDGLSSAFSRLGGAKYRGKMYKSHTSHADACSFSNRDCLSFTLISIIFAKGELSYDA